MGALELLKSLKPLKTLETLENPLPLKLIPEAEVSAEAVV